MHELVKQFRKLEKIISRQARHYQIEVLRQMANSSLLQPQGLYDKEHVEQWCMQLNEKLKTVNNNSQTFTVDIFHIEDKDLFYRVSI